MRSHTTNQTVEKHNLHDNICANDWIIKADDPLYIFHLTAVLSQLKPLEEQKYHQFCELIQVAKASHPSSDFYENDNGFSSHRRLSMLGQR